MKINEATEFLESIAHPSLQETYDNAGLITGDGDWECTGIICSLDATAEVVQEAIDKNCNMVVAHHPILFSGLKKITGKNYVEKAIILAIKNDIAIFAIHTNLDNILHGVNGTIAAKLELKNTSILRPKLNALKKIFTYTPVTHSDTVRNALFAAGAGEIGHYSECSFNTEGLGSFKASELANPAIGEIGIRHYEKEVKIEAIFPFYLESKIIAALKLAHPYEEVAYEIVALANLQAEIGSGILGELPQEMGEKDFLDLLKRTFGTSSIRHTQFINKKLKKVALCGGAGSFLISSALGANADAFITSDLKYHEFFDANDKLLLVDIGHYESEQFTIELLQRLLEEKFPTFAVLKTSVVTNAVHYF